jgi:TRAP-type C4-dicarboxylate transport system substrate-binding protein
MNTTTFRHSRRVLTAAAIAAAVVLVAGCTGSAPGSGVDEAEADFEPITLVCSTALPETNVQGSAEAAFMDYIEEHTDGKVTFERYWAGSLLPANEAVSGVQTGLADIAYGGALYTPQELPVNAWALGLGLAQSADTSAFGQLQNMLAAYELVRDTPAFEQEYNDLGLHPLAIYTQNQYGLACVEPLESPSDAEGIAASALPNWAAEVGSLGFETTFVPFGETYEALQRGVIDCLLSPLGGMYSIKTFEVAPYYLPIDFRTAFAIIQPVIALETWESLPPSIQAVFEDAAIFAMQQYVLTDLASTRTVVTGSGTASSFDILDATAFDEALIDVKAALLEDVVATAPAGIDDPEAVIDRYELLLAQWRTELEGLGASPVGRGEWATGIEESESLPVEEAFDLLRDKRGAAPAE